MSAFFANNDGVSLDDLLISEQPLRRMFKSYDPTAYLQDSNSGTFSQNQINYDTTPVTKNQWVDVHNGLLYLPVTITSACNTGALLSGYSATLKYGGILQLIDSIGVTVNNTNVTVNSRQNALYASIRALDNYSTEGIVTQADSFYLYPDSLDSWTLSFATPTVTAYTNWAVTPAVPSTISTAVNPGTYNVGIYNRCKLAAWPQAIAGLSTNAQLLHSSNFTTSASMCTINIHGFARLRDIHPLFQSIDCPMKNFNMQLIFNLNQINNASPGGTALAAAAVAGSVLGSSNPVQLTSQVAATTICTVSCVIPAGSNTRMYLPQVMLPPDVEAQLPAQAFTIRRFNDFQVAQYPGPIAANSAINWNIQNAITNLRSVSICSFISGTGNSQTGFSLMQAMTSPEPGIPSSPMVQLYNTQLYVNGLPVFRSQENYLPETWLQVVSQTRLNDSLDGIFCSGASGQDGWRRSYPGFLKYDVNRQTQGINAPVSLNFQCSNSTGFPIELWSVIEFEKVLRFEHNSGLTQITAFE